MNKCSICESLDIAVMAYTWGDNGKVGHILCEPCDRYCRPDSYMTQDETTTRERQTIWNY